MSSKNYSKGKKLETYLIRYLKALEPFVQWIQPKVNRRSKEHCDFVVATSQNVFFIECKETVKNKLYTKEYVAPHQMAIINSYNLWGYCAGLLIHFQKHDPDMENIRFVQNCKEIITIEDGIPFNKELFNILKKDPVI